MATRILLLLLVCIHAVAQITNVSIGSNPNDKAGDTLRTAFSKVNTNVAWLAGQLGSVTNSPNFTTNATVAGADVATKVVNVAALVALSPNQDGQLVQTLGYYSAGDGGGLVFRFSSSSSASTNYGTVIKPAVNGRFVWIGGDSVSLLAFGAKADASTDSTLQIQSAVDYCSANGVPLYVPGAAGYSFITDGITLSSYLLMYGDNRPSALNSAQSGVRSVIRKKSGGSNSPILTVPTGVQCSIRGIAFDGDRFNNGSVTNATVLLDGSGTNYDKRELEDVSVRYSQGPGIVIRSAEATLSRVHVFDGAGIGIYVRAQDNIWSHILIGRNGGDGLYIDNSSPFPSGAFRSYAIDSFQNQGWGVYLINPFNDLFDKLVCNLNNKGGVYLYADTSVSRNKFNNGEFVNNNCPDVVYANVRGSLSTSSSPYATGTYPNFHVTGTGSVAQCSWVNCSMSLSEASATKKPSYAMMWDVTGSPSGRNNIFVAIQTSSAATSTGATTSPSNLFGSTENFSFGAGDFFTGSYASSVYGGLNINGVTVTNGVISATGFSGSGDFSSVLAPTATLGSGSTTNSFTVGNGSQSGGSTTPTLSVNHNTTVSSFLQSIIPGQPTIRFRNLGSGAMDISDMSNSRIGQTLSIASSRVDLILGGNGPGPARTAYLRSPDSASGTDQVGSDLYLFAGRGTGAGARPVFVIQTPDPTASGATLQSLVNRLAVNSSGIVVVGSGAASTANADLQYTGSLLTRPWNTAATSTSDVYGFTAGGATWDSTVGKLRLNDATRYRYVDMSLSGSATWDIPNTAAQTEATTAVSVSGAAVGDFVSVAPRRAAAGFYVFGVVTSSGTVTLYAFNGTTSSVDPASQTYNIQVTKQ